MVYAFILYGFEFVIGGNYMGEVGFCFLVCVKIALHLPIGE